MLSYLHPMRSRGQRPQAAAAESDRSVAVGPGEDRDGKVAWSLVYWGWDVSHVRSDDGGCLFDHNPNVHACVASGDDWVWFERNRECVRRGALEGVNPPPLFYESPRLPAGTEALQGRCAD